MKNEEEQETLIEKNGLIASTCGCLKLWCMAMNFVHWFKKNSFYGQLFKTLISEFIFGFMNGFIPRVLRRLWRQPQIEPTMIPFASVGISVASASMYFVTFCLLPNSSGNAIITTETLLLELLLNKHMDNNRFESILKWFLTIIIHIVCSILFSEFADFIVPTDEGLYYISKFHASYQLSFSEDVSSRIWICGVIFFSIYLIMYDKIHRIVPGKERVTSIFDNLLLSITVFVSVLVLDNISGDNLNFISNFDTETNSWQNDAFYVMFYAQLFGGLIAFVFSFFANDWWVLMVNEETPEPAPKPIPEVKMTIITSQPHHLNNRNKLSKI